MSPDVQLWLPSFSSLINIFLSMQSLTISRSIFGSRPIKLMIKNQQCSSLCPAVRTKFIFLFGSAEKGFEVNMISGKFYFINREIRYEIKIRDISILWSWRQYLTREINNNFKFVSVHFSKDCKNRLTCYILVLRRSFKHIRTVGRHDHCF